MTNKRRWKKANKLEADWWGDCSNTYDEEQKQKEFAKLMGIEETYQMRGAGWKWPPYDLQGKSVLDIGGGPVSLLLKCRNRGKAVVVDPGDWPQWTLDRYAAAGIEFIRKTAEEYETSYEFDEVWIYNTLQHVIDPKPIAELALRVGEIVRVCEWLDTGTDELHLHNLTKDYLDELFKVDGRIVDLNWERYAPSVWVGVWPQALPSTKIDIPTSPTFHILGVAHTKTNREYMPCAYTQKVLKMIHMLTDMGQRVIHYGVEGSEVPCEDVVCLTDLEQKAVYGDYDWRSEFFKHDPKDIAYQTFNAKAIQAIQKRKTGNDVLLVPFGNYQKPIADAVGIPFSVEMGIGYEGVFLKYRVFESYAWMHHVYGLLGQRRGSWYDAVIPNYFDLDDFTFKKTKQDYFLYMGRMSDSKGVRLATEISRDLGVELVMAGQGDWKSLVVDGADVRYVGTVGAEERNELLGNAKALFVPTYYIEPFGGVAVEAQLCGTPVITTDWGVFSENMVHGVTGYRCRTYDDFLWAAQNVPSLDPHACRKFAETNYSMERVSKMYREYFQKILDINHADGWYRRRERTELDWLNKYYPANGAYAVESKAQKR